MAFMSPMDRWKYFDITHRDHVVCNPMSLAKIDEMVGLLDLSPGARVLDVACGKAELLVRVAERWGIRGVGVDLSPYVVRQAREKAAARGVSGRLVLVESDGAAWDPGPEPYDLAMCVGASWVFGGHAGTLRALRQRTRPGAGAGGRAVLAT